MSPGESMTLEFLTASETCCRETPRASSRARSTRMWYSRNWPPSTCTVATPSILASGGRSVTSARLRRVPGSRLADVMLYPMIGKTAKVSRSERSIEAPGGMVAASCDTFACTICRVCTMSVFQSKKRSISEEPRAVVDLIRAMPGMPLMASSIGLVTETSVCCAGATPFWATMMMRGKSVCGKRARGMRASAIRPPTESSAMTSSTARF